MRVMGGVCGVDECCGLKWRFVDWMKMCWNWV